MSLINVALRPTSALICVDTQMAAADVGLFEGPKMVHLPHSNLVLAVRGMNVLLAIIYGQVVLAGPVAFAALAERLPEFLRTAMQHMLASPPPAASGLTVQRQELVLVGHCAATGRMRCTTYAIDLDGTEQSYELQAIDMHLAPWHEDWGEPPMADSADRMGFVAAMQVERARAMNPGQAIGGRLLLGELSKDSFSMRTLVRES